MLLGDEPIKALNSRLGAWLPVEPGEGGIGLTARLTWEWDEMEVCAYC